MPSRNALPSAVQGVNYPKGNLAARLTILAATHAKKKPVVAGAALSIGVYALEADPKKAAKLLKEWEAAKTEGQP